jgi:hypothetical protein
MLFLLSICQVVQKKKVKKAYLQFAICNLEFAICNTPTAASCKKKYKQYAVSSKNRRKELGQIIYNLQ